MDPVRITGGGVHVPFRICSPGRYVRITILNIFETEGAGEKFNSSDQYLIWNGSY